jgi:hypothetical protein
MASSAPGELPTRYMVLNSASHKARLYSSGVLPSNGQALMRCCVS